MPPALMNFLRLEQSNEFMLFRGLYATIRSIIVLAWRGEGLGAASYHSRGRSAVACLMIVSPLLPTL